MYYIGLDVHKKTISYCVKDAAGQVQSEGKIASTRQELSAWVRALPQPRMMAMEATLFSGWIYDLWRHDCNEQRPHSSLNYRTPAEFARQASYGKDVGSAHFENADGVSNFPTASAAAG